MLRKKTARSLSSTDGQFLAWAILSPAVRLQNRDNGSFCVLPEDYHGDVVLARNPF
jgi:hypothetical protein